MKLEQILENRISIKLLFIIVLFFAFSSKANWYQDNIDKLEQSKNISCTKFVLPKFDTSQQLQEFFALAKIFNMTNNQSKEDKDGKQEIINACSTDDKTVSFCIDKQCYQQIKEGKEIITTIGQGYPIKLRVVELENRLCIQYYIHKFGYQTVGCKEIKNKESENRVSSLASCYDNGKKYSKSFVPFTGIVIACVNDAMKDIFRVKKYNERDNKLVAALNPLYEFQNSMRSVVKALLILYVSIFGASIVLSSQIPDKRTVALFFIKFILVLYFSVGIQSPQEQKGLVNHKDGLTTIVKPFFENLTFRTIEVFSKNMGNKTLCQYSTNNYHPDYKFLSIWDRFDCRILYYFGFDIDRIINLTQNGISLLLYLFLPIMGKITAAFFLSHIIFMLAGIFFAIFLLSLVISFTSYVALAIIGLAITIYLGPLFIPLALFKVTEEIFKKWLNLLFGFALQPLIFMAFISLVFTVFDQIAFGNCVFEDRIFSWGEIINNFTNKDSLATKDSFDKEFLDKRNNYFKISSSGELDPNCSSSFGYILRGADSKLQFISGIFTTYSFIGYTPNLLSSLLAMAIFAYIAYNFANNIGQFAGSILGAVHLGRFVIKPTTVSDIITGYGELGAKAGINKVINSAKKRKEGPSGSKMHSSNTKSGGSSKVSNTSNSTSSTTNSTNVKGGGAANKAVKTIGSTGGSGAS